MSNINVKPIDVVRLDANADINAELDRLRTRRQEIADARLARAEAEAPHAKLAAEQLALRDDEAIEAAEAKEGPVGKRIQVVNTDLGVVIVRRAHPATFKQWLDRNSRKDHISVGECEELARKCLVHPTLSEFESMCDQYPALPGQVATAVAFLAGVRTKDVSGK